MSFSDYLYDTADATIKIKVLPTFHTYSFFKASDGSMLDFHPEGERSRFSWSSPSMDKVGTYRFEQKGELIYLELEFNFRRESSYVFTIMETKENIITSFILKDKFGGELTFRLS